MAFAVLSDTSGNVPKKLLEEKNIPVIPFVYSYDGEDHVCEDVEKETDGEISAEKAAWILYYEEEDSHGTEAESALTEAKEGLYGEEKEEFLSYIRDSLEMLDVQ